MLDFLDFLQIKDEEVLTGTYYARRPLITADTGIRFQYDIVDESDKSYATILNNLKTERTLQTIKTNDMCGFKVNGYIVTQDGDFWQITGIIKRLVKPENKQALRILKQTVETTYIIRLMQVENPMELK